jgi:hypothetical protein
MEREGMQSRGTERLLSGRRVFTPGELAFALLGAAAGLGWGLASLILGISLHLVQIPSPLRLAALLFILPFSLAGWLGSTLQLPLVDPTGLVIATGSTLGLVTMAAWLGFKRWRDR